MALPKYKTRRSHSRSRRAMNFLGTIKTPEMNSCPRCSSLKRTHFACPQCGFYAGRQVFVKRERVKKTQEDS